MAKKFYGVKAGFQTGVYTSWDDCKKQTEGYSGASFKGFSTRQEAEDYVAGGNHSTSSCSSDNNTLSDEKCIHVYVDGSFKADTNEYGMGFLIIKDGEIIRVESKKGNNPEYALSRNVAGEVWASSLALSEAYKLYGTEYSVVVHHDYEGVGKWADGEWKANKTLTQRYKGHIKELRDKKLNITFIHVKGHSGDKYNELADMLARYSLDLLNDNEIVIINELFRKEMQL